MRHSSSSTTTSSKIMKMRETTWAAERRSYSRRYYRNSPTLRENAKLPKTPKLLSTTGTVLVDVDFRHARDFFAFARCLRSGFY